MTSTTLRRGRAAVIAAGLIAVGAVAAGSTAEAEPAAGTNSTYVVLYRQGASSTSAAAAVKAAGGTLVANYREIGVVIARSSSAGFEASIEGARGVENAVATGNFGVSVGDAQAGAGPISGDAPAAASDLEPLAGLQWDMRQINAFAAHDITGGSPNVVVGDVDTGLDFTHPDIAPNYDAANSTDCSGGSSGTAAAWQ